MNTRTSFGRDFQEGLLERLCERRQITTLFLRNRMALRGRIACFDAYVLLLEPLDGSPQVMIYKSAVVSISGPPRPQRPSRGRPPRRDDEEGKGEGEPRPTGPERREFRPPGERA